MGKIKALFSKWQVLLLLFFLVLAVWTINPQPNATGLSIIAVEPNTSSFDSGIAPPAEGTLPISRERILLVDNSEVNSVEDYRVIVSRLKPNEVVHIKTLNKPPSYFAKDDLEQLFDLRLVKREELNLYGYSKSKIR